MSTKANAIQIEKQKEHLKRDKLNHIYKEHGELIAAIASGIIILAAWLLESHLPLAVFSGMHIAAFIIGGYAKAKEGITETIKNKELNVELLMIFAAIGSAAIGFWTEGAILIFIFALAGALETYTMNKSNKEISALMELQPEEALRITNGIEKTVPVSELVIGDEIFVRASERIPADGVIIKGNTAIDESAITGESIPVNKAIDQDVFAGTVAMNGSITVKITKNANETLFHKIIQMVQQAKEEKSKVQLFIEKFEGTYVNIVIVTVIVMMFLPYLLFDWTLTQSIYRAMVLLVVASPCALVASIMPATLSAISNSAKNGVLFKGGVHVENFNNMKLFAFDKTGTLTNGKPIVTDAYFDPNYDENLLVSTVGAIENESTHPLARAITSYSLKEEKNRYFIKNSTVENMKTVGGNGVEATVRGEKWHIGKSDFVGKDLAEQFQEGIAAQLAKQGKTIVFVKHAEKVVALFALKDTIRNDAKQTIKTLKQHGIDTIMLTGDNEITARAVAEEVGVDRYIAECLPEDKVKELKRLKKQYKQVAMVGDGINDAPALATANVGVSMGEGTDVALETADIVLMKNNLSKITSAIDLSKRMNRIVKQNVFFSLAVIVTLIFSNFFQIIDLPLGVIGHEGSTIIVILNGLRLLKQT
ncbi:heavy metal translocating P-type ATPase [Virgibacillus sp. W0430]|uniref:heavy metal translocating P-type ATPase n=1 Tax=Virgibacillus sp. W0430 TaxID=3391580 RepID=UPI003F464A57